MRGDLVSRLRGQEDTRQASAIQNVTFPVYLPAFHPDCRVMGVAGPAAAHTAAVTGALTTPLNPDPSIPEVRLSSAAGWEGNRYNLIPQDFARRRCVDSKTQRTSKNLHLMTLILNKCCKNKTLSVHWNNKMGRILGPLRRCRRKILRKHATTMLRWRYDSH